LINMLLLLALTAVTSAAVFGGRMLYRLHRRCLGVERSQDSDPGLLRWYAQGFEQPIRLAQWVVRISLALTLIAVLGHAHPALIVASFCTLALSYMELRFGGRRQRDHQRAVAERFSDSPRR
jgi:hypothetical protein